MAVVNGVTQGGPLGLPNSPTSTRAGLSALLGTVFRTIIHLRPLRQPRRSSRLEASPSCFVLGRRALEDADVVQRDLPPLIRVDVKESSRAKRRTSGSPQLPNSLLAALLAIGVASGLVKAGGGGDVTLEVISAWGGPVNTVHIEGNLAYIGSGRRMVILDITDFGNITEVGSIQLLSTVQGLVVRDGYAYIATTTDSPAGGFCTIDVSDISNLRLAWCSETCW